MQSSSDINTAPRVAVFRTVPRPFGESRDISRMLPRIGLESATLYDPNSRFIAIIAVINEAQRHIELFPVL